MIDAPDATLLDEFARNDSEEAFAEIVRRHIGLVHSVALRRTNNSQHAEDITQAVFIILARKASSLGRKTILSGWLYHTARLTAANFQRAEFRRVYREQEAFMQSSADNEQIESAWRELGPLLEEAMAKLRTTDRDAIVLRFFENKSLLEVGTTMGLEERAAQKRVVRGLEKLRAFFTKRGVVLSATVIAGAVSANSVKAASPALAASVKVVAVAKGSAAGTSTLTLVKGVLKIMAWSNSKIAAVSIAVVLLAGGTTTIAVKQIRERPRPNLHQDQPVNLYKGQPATYWLDQVYSGSPTTETYGALRYFGPSVAAPLVQALTMTNSPPGSQFSSDDTHIVVFGALEAIGPAAKSQVPELIQLLQHPDMQVRVFATLVLADIGPEASAAIPALLEESRDTTNGIWQISDSHGKRSFTPLAPYAQEALRHIDNK